MKRTPSVQNDCGGLANQQLPSVGVHVTVYPVCVCVSAFQGNRAELAPMYMQSGKRCLAPFRINVLRAIFWSYSVPFPTLFTSYPFPMHPTSCHFSTSSPPENQMRIKEVTNTLTLKKKTSKTKIHKQEKHGVHLVLPNYSWAWGLPWSVVAMPADTLLEKTDFSFPDSYQLHRFLARGGLRVQFLFSGLGLSGLNLWMLRHSLVWVLVSHSLWVHMRVSVPLCLEDAMLFFCLFGFGVIRYLWLLRSFSLLFWTDP